MSDLSGKDIKSIYIKTLKVYTYLCILRSGQGAENCRQRQVALLCRLSLNRKAVGCAADKSSSCVAYIHGTRLKIPQKLKPNYNMLL